MTIIIAKNNTGSAIPLDDLGVEIPGAGQRNLTETFSVVEIYTSTNLKSYVQSGDIIINDGISNLTIADGLRHINFETEYEDVDPMDSTSIISHSLADHTDVSGLVPTEEYVLKFINGKWQASQLHYNDSPAAPDSTSVIWISPTYNDSYYFHEPSGLWLSTAKYIYTFGRSGNIDGSYLGIGGWATGGYYYMQEPGGVITSIYCRAETGQLNKQFEIRVNGVSILTFNLVNLKYETLTCSLDIPTGSIMQVWCSIVGNPVGDVVCQLTMHWKSGV